MRDAKSDPRVCDNLAVRDLNVIAYLGVPLRMPDGSVLGSLCAIDGEGRDWTPEDISALWDLAQIVIDEITLRLEMGKRREAEREQKLARPQKLLIGELHHRVKNSLAVVQSIVEMSVKTATNLLEFREAVTARLVGKLRRVRGLGDCRPLHEGDERPEAGARSGLLRQ